MNDFENWNNDPMEDFGGDRSVARAPHISPESVARIRRGIEMRRERRGRMLLAIVVLVVVALTICAWLRL